MTPPARHPSRLTVRLLAPAALALAALTGLPAYGQAVGAQAMPGGPGSAGTRPGPRDPSGVTGNPRIIDGPNGTVFVGQGGPNGVSAHDILPVYFPAQPPVLGASPAPSPLVRDPLWTELAPYSRELFFAPLSTRLSQGKLNRRYRQKLDAFVETRSHLLADVRARIALADGKTALPPAPALEAGLRALDDSADTLRRELYQGSLLVAGCDWNEHRNWYLGNNTEKRTRQEILYDEMSVLRAAVYYQEGLAATQRQLLGEIVTELTEALGDTPAAAPEETFEPEQVIFFLPHGSRLRVPAGLPATLQARIAEFAAEKASLKRELRDALVSLDKAGAGKREKALRELAARQEPRLAALEAAAERIRSDLAPLPESSWKAPADHSALPPELAARLGAYLRKKSALQEAARQAEAVTRPDGNGKAGNPQDKSAPGAGLAEFEARNRERFAELAAEARAIRDQVAALAARGGAGGGKSVDALLADFMAAYKQQQLFALYADYRIAVLQPGLTPGERRLLFDAAIESLDLTGVKDWQAVPE